MAERPASTSIHKMDKEKRLGETPPIPVKLTGFAARAVSEPDISGLNEYRRETEKTASTEALNQAKASSRKRRQIDNEMDESSESWIWPSKELDELLSTVQRLVKETVPHNTKDNIKHAIAAIEIGLKALENKKRSLPQRDSEDNIIKLRAELNEKEAYSRLLKQQLLEKEETNKKQQETTAETLLMLNRQHEQTIMELKEQLTKEQDLRKQLQEQIKELEAAKPRTPEEIKQAEEEQKAHEILQNLREAKDIEAVKAEIAKDWPRKAYKGTRPIKTSIIGDREVRAVLVQDKNAKDKELIQRLTQYFPAATRLGELAVGKVGAIEIHQGNIDLGEPASTEEPPTTTSRTLIVGKVGEEDNLDSTIEVMEKIIEKMNHKLSGTWKAQDARRRGALHLTEGTNAELTRKAVEYCLLKAEGEVDLCVKRKAIRTEGRKRGLPKSKAEAILIKTTDKKTPAEWSSILQREVDIVKAGVTVRNIVHLPDGGIKVIYKENQKGATTSFLESIKSKTSLDAQETQPSTKIRILGINKEANKETIEHAVRRELNLTDSETVVVEEPRQNKMGKWGATIQLERQKAETLLAKGKLIIGWVSYPLIEWIVPPCCFKCQKMGHWERDCKEAKAANIRCHKCGEEGHPAKTCDKVARCYNCKDGDTGHAANSMECPAYRQCIREIRDRKSEARAKDPKQRTPVVHKAKEQDPTTQDVTFQAAIAGKQPATSGNKDDDGFVPYKKTMRNPKNKDKQEGQNKSDDDEETEMHTD